MNAPIPFELLPSIEQLHKVRADFAKADKEKHLLNLSTAACDLRVLSVELTLDLIAAGIKPKQVRKIVFCRD